MGVRHTGLGEESTEAVIRVSGLALFGQETIRLKSEICQQKKKKKTQRLGSEMRGFEYNVPECRARGSRAKHDSFVNTNNEF